jgi:hypothetical protein
MTIQKILCPLHSTEEMEHTKVRYDAEERAAKKKSGDVPVEIPHDSWSCGMLGCNLHFTEINGYIHVIGGSGSPMLTESGLPLGQVCRNHAVPAWMVVTSIGDRVMWACRHENCDATVPFDGIKGDAYAV